MTDQNQYDEDAPPRRESPKGITTVEELQALNNDEVVRGYRAGLKNEPDFSVRDPGYWHGFLNGMVDGKHAQITNEQAALARKYVESGALKADVEKWQRAGAPAASAQTV